MDIQKLELNGELTLAQIEQDAEVWAIERVVEMLWRSGDYTPEMRRRILAYLTARNENDLSTQWR